MFNQIRTTRGQNEEGNPGDTLNYAHEYLDRGFAPVPVEFRSKACTRKEWPKLRLRPDELEDAFQAPCNVGILLGDASQGLVDIDLDCAEAILLAPHMLPPTGMIFGRKSKPASHLIYRSCDARESLRLADPEGRGMLVELRADGCMTVFPPSVHVSGEEIRFDERGEPEGVEFQQLAECAHHLAAASVLLRYWGKGNRHDLALALSGTFLKAGKNEADAWRLMQVLINVAADDEQEDRRQCLSSTARRLKAGQPIRGKSELAEIIGERATKRVCEWLGLTGSSVQSRVQAGTALETFGGPAPQSDVANAERFAARHSSKAAYCPELKSWLVWDGCRWIADAGGQAMRLAIATGREIALEAAERGDKDSLKWAAQVNDAPRLRNMVSLAQSYCETSLNAFDADPWKLNCNSEIIDLKTGELLPHSPGALMRKLATVDFEPKAECPTFLKFLDRIFEGDEELIGFLQRAIGYSLTGDISEQVLFVLNGNGANGKSTLIQVIQDLLGDYAQQTPTETLMVSRSSGVPNDIARLEGARYVAAVETEAGQRLAEAKLKQLTGGDRIAARFLYGEHFEFTPQFKLWLATNKLPEVKGTDDAIWRRFQIIKFNVTIPEPERDRSLREKLKAELPGILNWGIAGCLEWQRTGLRPPAKVRDATKAYRSEMDVVAQFIEDCCTADRQADVTVKAFYDSYVEWCHANGETAVAKKSVGQRLVEMGFRQGHTRNARKWLGIRVKTDAELLKLQEIEPPKGFYKAANDDGCELEHELADVAAG